MSPRHESPLEPRPRRRRYRDPDRDDYEDGSVSRYCPECDRRVRVVADTPNHILHLLLTVFTVGAWLLVWIIFCLFSGTYRCSRCGTAV